MERICLAIKETPTKKLKEIEEAVKMAQRKEESYSSIYSSFDQKNKSENKDYQPHVKCFGVCVMDCSLDSKANTAWHIIEALLRMLVPCSGDA